MKLSKNLLMSVFLVASVVAAQASPTAPLSFEQEKEVWDSLTKKTIKFNETFENNKEYQAILSDWCAATDLLVKKSMDLQAQTLTAQEKAVCDKFLVSVTGFLQIVLEVMDMDTLDMDAQQKLMMGMQQLVVDLEPLRLATLEKADDSELTQLYKSTYKKILVVVLEYLKQAHEQLAA